jgi:hypothetical protein
MPILIDTFSHIGSHDPKANIDNVGIRVDIDDVLSYAVLFRDFRLARVERAHACT